MVRGGSWNDDVPILRVSFRNNLSAADRGLNLGFPLCPGRLSLTLVSCALTLGRAGSGRAPPPAGRRQAEMCFSGESER